MLTCHVFQMIINAIINPFQPILRIKIQFTSKAYAGNVLYCCTKQKYQKNRVMNKEVQFHCLAFKSEVTKTIITS